MSSLSFIDKERIADFFGFNGGYVFSFLDNGYNKNNTQRMILEATGIDIYKDSEYVSLSQERCIRKILDEKDDYSVGCLIKVMMDYYRYVTDDIVERYKQEEYEYLVDLEKKLCSGLAVQLPTVEKCDFVLLKQDIERNITANTPELVLDRLHTFATQFFREISDKHDIPIINERGDNFSLDTLAANLRKYYRDNEYFSSEFCIVAIQNSINVFARFNDIRNKHSFSHPNPVLNKLEAEYVVRIVSDTLTFIDNIERAKDQDFATDDDLLEDLPF